MTATGSITGASTLLVVAWLEERRGPGTVELLFQRLRDQRGHAVTRETFTPRSKVDYRLHVNVLEEVAQLADGDEDTLRQIGRNGALNVELAVPGAGLLLKVANPKRLLKRADKLWSTYADFGFVEVLELGKNGAKLRIAGFETHPHFCRTLEGFFEGLLERTGATQVRVRELAHDGSADGCVFEGTWA